MVAEITEFGHTVVQLCHGVSLPSLPKDRSVCLRQAQVMDALETGIKLTLLPRALFPLSLTTLSVSTFTCPAAAPFPFACWI